MIWGDISPYSIYHHQLCITQQSNGVGVRFLCGVDGLETISNNNKLIFTTFIDEQMRCCWPIQVLMVISLWEKHNNNIQFDSVCIWEKGVDAVCCYLAALVHLWLVQYTNLIRWHISKQQKKFQNTAHTHSKREPSTTQQSTSIRMHCMISFEGISFMIRTNKRYVVIL